MFIFHNNPQIPAQALPTYENYQWHKIINNYATSTMANCCALINYRQDDNLLIYKDHFKCI